MDIIKTQWLADERLVISQLSGELTSTDIDYWIDSLESVLSRLPANQTFHVFFNLVGFKADSLETHKKFRRVIPLTMADYGWKVGYVDLVDDASQLIYQTKRGIRCLAAAHAHQDATKMAAYEERFGRDTEHFFTDPFQAEAWIRSVSRGTFAHRAADHSAI